MGTQKYLSIILLGVFAFLLFDVEVVVAHIPHDKILEVEISPNFDQDKTLYIHNPVESGLLKSEDAGQSWKAIDQTLDNKYQLSDLDISSYRQNTLFLSSRGDGVYKSEDGGTSWYRVNHGLGTLDIDLVSIAPDSTDVVLAAGAEAGLYKTKDGGKNWYQVLEGEGQITAITFYRKQKGHVVVGNSQGNLYFSSDEGEEWRRFFVIRDSGAISAIVVSPNYSVDKTIFAGTGKRGIFKSVDGGVFLKEEDEGLTDQAIISLAISPNYQTDSTLFASTWHEGVFQSSDGGKMWRKSSKGLTKSRQADKFEQSHFRELEISPKFGDDKTLFLGGFDGLFKSTDGGRVWRQVDTVNTVAGRVLRGLGVSPNYGNDSTLVVAIPYRGAYRSNDQGTTWAAINTGIELALPVKDYRNLYDLVFSADYRTKHYHTIHLYDLVFSPNYHSDGTLFSITWGRLLRYRNRDERWNRISITSYTKYDCRIAISPSFVSDNIIYLGTIRGEIFMSTDRGATFEFIGDIGDRIHSLAISADFLADNTLFAGVPGVGVYKSIDGGYTWQSASDGIDLDLKGELANSVEFNSKRLAISPNYKVDQTVLAGTRAGLFVTRDGAKSWMKMGGGADDLGGYIEGITISPNYRSDQTFIVRVKGRGLFKTVNNGLSFTQIIDYFDTSSAPVQLVEFSPVFSIDQTIYGSAGVEILRSKDGGETWKTISTMPMHRNDIVTGLFLRLTASLKTKVLTASVAALLGYMFFGLCGLEKKLPFRKWQIKAGGASVVFVVFLTLLSQ